MLREMLPAASGPCGLVALSLSNPRPPGARRYAALVLQERAALQAAAAASQPARAATGPSTAPPRASPGSPSRQPIASASPQASSRPDVPPQGSLSGSPCGRQGRGSGLRSPAAREPQTPRPCSAQPPLPAKPAAGSPDPEALEPTPSCSSVPLLGALFRARRASAVGMQGERSGSLAGEGASVAACSSEPSLRKQRPASAGPAGAEGVEGQRLEGPEAPRRQRRSLLGVFFKKAAKV